MLGGFLVLNMIVGVVVEIFNAVEKDSRTKKDAGQGKKQESTRWIHYLPFALVVLRLQFEPLGIIS